MKILTEQLASMEILIMYGCLIDDEALPQRIKNLKVLCVENFLHDTNGTWIISLDVRFDCFISTEILQEILRLKYVKSLHYQLNDIIMPHFNVMDIH